MIAPTKPNGLEEAVGKPMYKFLTTQLGTILEGETQEARDVANTLFARGMERLYKRGVKTQYTTYYEEMLEVVQHGRKFMDTDAGKQMKNDTYIR